LLPASELTMPAKKSFSESQMEVLRKKFLLFDRKNSGSIAKTDIPPLIRSFGQNPTPKETDALMVEVDADKSGTIEFDEFVELVRKVYKPYALMASNMQKSFDVFDADKNGYLDKEELFQVLSNMGAPSDPEALRSTIEAADLNGDGKIDRVEFVKLMLGPAPTIINQDSRYTWFQPHGKEEKKFALLEFEASQMQSKTKKCLGSVYDNDGRDKAISFGKRICQETAADLKKIKDQQEQTTATLEELQTTNAQLEERLAEVRGEAERKEHAVHALESQCEAAQKEWHELDDRVQAHYDVDAALGAESFALHEAIQWYKMLEANEKFPGVPIDCLKEHWDEAPLEEYSRGIRGICDEYDRIELEEADYEPRELGHLRFKEADPARATDEEFKDVKACYKELYASYTAGVRLLNEDYKKEAKLRTANAVVESKTAETMHTIGELDICAGVCKQYLAKAEEAMPKLLEDLAVVYEDIQILEEDNATKRKEVNAWQKKTDERHQKYHENLAKQGLVVPRTLKSSNFASQWKFTDTAYTVNEAKRKLAALTGMEMLPNEWEEEEELMELMEPPAIQIVEKLPAIQIVEKLPQEIHCCDIGIWGNYDDRVGAQFLAGGSGSIKEQCGVWESFREETKEKHPNGVPENHTPLKEFTQKCLLDPAARTKLMQCVDSKNTTGQQDFKLDLTMPELTALVGDNAVTALKDVWGDERISEIKIRRVEPQGGLSINFHLDHAARTMQVPLSEEEDYSGGRLIFATPQGLHWPSRKVGTATIHDNTIPHGVTAHTSGIRYGFFFLQQAN